MPRTWDYCRKKLKYAKLFIFNIIIIIMQMKRLHLIHEIFTLLFTNVRAWFIKFGDGE